MIRDPGAAPHENPEPPQVTKYDRIPYDLGHRPPAASAAQPPPPPQSSVTAMEVDDSEIPLDMTVRRKNSDRQTTTPTPASANSVSASAMQVSDQQNSPSPPSSVSSCCSGDAPINLNTRPSVITKAPPPPIKKRISSMHTNGEIVIKSAVGDNLSPVNCDVFIEEHFRRSLGNTYASIYGNNNNNNNQQKSSGSDTRNSSTSSSSSISSSSSSSGIGSVASSNSSTNSLLGSSTINFSVSSHLVGNASPVVARHNHVIPPVDIVPLLKVKAEPVLPVVQQQQQQPPQQPPSPVQQIRPAADAKPIKTEPGTMQYVRPDSEEEVDDHFAKALGNDTWKMIQEKKMNL